MNKLHALFILCSLTIVSCTTATHSTEWINLGPFYPDASLAVIDSVGNLYVGAGASSGAAMELYRLSPGMSTWKRVEGTDQFVANNRPYTIAATNSALILLTATGELFRSTDQGGSWTYQSVLEGIDEDCRDYLCKLHYIKNGKSVVAALEWGKHYHYSSDGGSSWEKSAPGLGSIYYMDIVDGWITAFHDMSAVRLVDPSGIHHSSTQLEQLGLEFLGLRRLERTGSGLRYVYETKSGDTMFLKKDRYLSNTTDPIIHKLLDIEYTEPSNVLDVAPHALYTLANGAISEVAFRSKKIESQIPAPFEHYNRGLATFQRTSTWSTWLDQFGLRIFDPSSETWRFSNKNLPNNIHVSSIESIEDTIFLIGNGFLFVGHTDSPDWEVRSSVFGDDSSIQVIGNRWLSTEQAWGLGYKVSTDRGYGWEGASSSDNTEIVMDSYATVYSSDCHLFVGPWSDVIWRSTDCGETWSTVEFQDPVARSNAFQHTSATIINGSGSSVIVVHANLSIPRVHFSVNNGDSWISSRPIEEGTELYGAVASSDVGIIATKNDGLFRTANAGKTWEHIALENLAPDMADSLTISGIIMKESSVIVSLKSSSEERVGTHGYLSISTDAGKTWAPLEKTAREVTAMHATSSRLFVALKGVGVAVRALE